MPPAPRDTTSLPGLPHVDGVTHSMVDIGGLSVHVAEAGSGPPLLLLHGWPQHWYAWRRLVPLLADDYRLIMPDLRGQGWSSVPPGGYDKEQLATDLLGLLDTLGVERTGLVGHDWGGWAGFLACLRAPHRFDAFLALGVTHPFQHPDLRMLHLWRLGYQVPLATPVLAEALLRMTPSFVESVLAGGTATRGALPAADRRVFADVLRDPARARASSQLYRRFVLGEGLRVVLGRYRGRRLTVPTRLVNGAEDPVITARFLAGWEGHADDMSAELLPGCGHFVPEEAPEQVARHVRELISRG
jgi:pimeloyl-ACP methyl ester carboxylesterase